MLYLQNKILGYTLQAASNVGGGGGSAAGPANAGSNGGNNATNGSGGGGGAPNATTAGSAGGNAVASVSGGAGGNGGGGTGGGAGGTSTVPSGGAGTAGTGGGGGGAFGTSGAGGAGGSGSFWTESINNTTAGSGGGGGGSNNTLPQAAGGLYGGGSGAAGSLATLSTGGQGIIVFTYNTTGGLNTSGPISLAGTTVGQSIALELGSGATSQISLNDAAVRTLAGVPSGAITMPTNFYGKSYRVAVNLTISANTQNYCIFANKGGTYVAGKTCVNLTINSGVVVGSSSNATFALNTGSGWASGDVINITNNGSIVGRGGCGGLQGCGIRCAAPGTPGGVALKLQYATNITNNGTIGGGGGGAGGGAVLFGCGGGGGGGAGNTIGAAGEYNDDGGGTAATTTNGGNGYYGTPVCTPPAVGIGGAAGVAGTNGATARGFTFNEVAASGGGGGGLGASGGSGGAFCCCGSFIAGGSPGAGGKATCGAGTYATWLKTGTRYGTID